MAVGIILAIVFGLIILTIWLCVIAFKSGKYNERNAYRVGFWVVFGFIFGFLPTLFYFLGAMNNKESDDLISNKNSKVDKLTKKIDDLENKIKIKELNKKIEDLEKSKK